MEITGIVTGCGTFEHYGALDGIEIQSDATSETYFIAMSLQEAEQFSLFSRVRLNLSPALSEGEGGVT